MCTFYPELRSRCSQGGQQNLLWITVGKYLEGLGRGAETHFILPKTSSAKKGPIFTSVFYSQLRQTWRDGWVMGPQGGYPDPEGLLFSSRSVPPSYRDPASTGPVITRKGGPGGLLGHWCQLVGPGPVLAGLVAAASPHPYH